MRVVNELVNDGIRISLFEWNNKYIIKFELGNMEQTFKVPAMDVLEENDLEALMGGVFFEQVKKRFDEMHQSLQNVTKNF
ncbi:hypothetical protein [Cyclobacterium marinum]|uniref:Uncharacterized protein n=1 Tax=Cyclobacterium marinum (strain ATCC 25205 / DSM 745 / LMG 13164 / NCIMB 1802) TaxID=880070 RepID=G0J567_CYCMS|nr:hypothetical protein [Cyclobacterium marinum]AEL26751.1 hypothetical protein Cycma_3023 [Cyclobacterium marinum DSM 745]MBI0400099.1 hypothetical protein [Cyclobacterium marinum]MBR9774592.1 hypothetical protein [Cytophagales bacterium]|tara:strand:- start:18973 stop:19212 length:240 start_codon:yes stop_codon:yes gene_type:complete